MDDLKTEIRNFRRALGETQQSLANRMGLSLRTMAGYESDRPPRGRTLSRFVELARDAGRKDFVEIFDRFLEIECSTVEAREINDIAVELLQTRGYLMKMRLQNEEELRRSPGIAKGISDHLDRLERLQARIDELDPYSSAKRGEGHE